MRETHPHTALQHEKLFVAVCAITAVLCVALAFWYAVPQQASDASVPDSTPLSAYWRVDLNTADADALCTLPGVGPSRASALVEYREQHGPFACVADAAAVPGLTEDIVASWGAQAYVSTPAQTVPEGTIKGE